MTIQALPPGWGKDALTVYLDAYRANQFATFANKPTAMADLIKIDGLFDRLLNGAMNPQPIYPMNFMLRAHSAFRSGVTAVMGGQIFESHGLLRLSLEHAAYGYYIGSDSGRMERWLRRDESGDNRKSVRKEFHNEKIKGYIEASAPQMLKIYNHLYNQLIEFGAHPNEMGYSLNSNVSEVDGNVHFETLYLQGDSIQLDMSMKVAGQVGFTADAIAIQ